jgi:RimJ/RimL family protein N-acetyltransferase
MTYLLNTMKKIRLRALTISDIDKTLNWHNQEEISELYSGHPFPVNIEMERKWYEKILTSNFPVTVFGIEEIEKNCLIGITVLKDINLINRSAEFAVYIGDKEYRGKGLSKEASFLTLTFAFNNLGLNRIFLKVLEENEVAIKLYRSVGFIEEGKLRKSVFKNNQFKNEIVMGILKEEFNG